jgi:superfamily II DNA/RNA helicase
VPVDHAQAAPISPGAATSPTRSTAASVPAVATFTDLGLTPALTRALAKTGVTVPTPVQLAVLPDALARRDVLGKAATGSGKTLAFGLPVLARLAGGRTRSRSPRAIVIVPTRELAGQVRTALEPLASAVGLRVATVYGGTPYDRQIKRLRAGVDLVIATPGRLDDLVRRGACLLDDVQVLVLDEADHLCDLGFYPVVSGLVSKTPATGQRMLLSATLDGDVDRLVRAHLKNPVLHDCALDEVAPDLTHHVLVTGTGNKIDSAARLLRANPRSIVFTRTRRGATRLATDLAARGITTVDLHGSLSQNARERNLRKFKNGQADVVVATDVAARGIHVDGIGLVVHYDAPTESKAYVHRSGRTARAGSSGAVVTMATHPQVSEIGRLHRAAGVTARHHDVSSAPEPMTSDALAEAGTVVTPGSLPSSPSQGRSGRPSGRSGAPRSGNRSGRTYTGQGSAGRPNRKPRHGQSARRTSASR